MPQDWGKKYWNSLFSAMNVLMNLQRAAEWRVRLTLEQQERREERIKKGFEKKNSLTNTQTQNFRSASFLNHILWKNISTWFAPTFTIISFKSHTHTQTLAHQPIFPFLYDDFRWRLGRFRTGIWSGNDLHKNVITWAIHLNKSADRKSKSTRTSRSDRL